MFTENLTEFFDTVQGFAVTATHNGTTSVDGIFDDEYFEVGQQFVGHQSHQPFFLYPAAALAAVTLGDLLEVGNNVYEVVTIEPDGLGLTRLKLELNPDLSSARLVSTGDRRVTSDGSYRITN